jgi:hypothetical protein
MAPTTIFIVPYRDRLPQKAQFEKYFDERVSKQSGMETAEYYFVHQKDSRPFNRGAIKNIGFLILSRKYPGWKDITFVFHDLDHYPKSHITFPYITEPGIVKHYYGFKNTLGGAVAIKGGDFIKTGGFPMFWGWGYEDNEFNKRVLSCHIKIDRSNFIELNGTREASTALTVIEGEGHIRSISKEDVNRFFSKTTEGLNQVRNIDYSTDNRMIDVVNFNTATLPSKMYEYDIRSGEKNLMNYISGKNIVIRNRKWGLVISKNLR